MPARFTAAVLVIPLVAASSSLCFAAQYTASPDRQPGTLTIETAFERLKAGDTLLLRGGTYYKTSGEQGDTHFFREQSGLSGGTIRTPTSWDAIRATQPLLRIGRINS